MDVSINNNRYRHFGRPLVQTRSIVYIQSEKHIVPFSGEPRKDVYTVGEFIEEVERGMRARGLHSEEQADFIFSLLKGSALEEVKLRMGGQVKQPSDLFSYLRGAFREQRTTPQLLHAFYAHRQLAVSCSIPLSNSPLMQ